MSKEDRIFFENLSGYAFILMFVSIILIIAAVNPLIIVVPVAVYYTIVSVRYIRNYDWLHSVGKVW